MRVTAPSMPRLDLPRRRRLLVAGQPSTPMALDLQLPRPRRGRLDLPIRHLVDGRASRVPQRAPSGHTFSVTVPAGATVSASFYYQDAEAGSPVLTASAQNLSSSSRPETVNPGPRVSDHGISGVGQPRRGCEPHIRRHRVRPVHKSGDRRVRSDMDDDGGWRNVLTGEGDQHHVHRGVRPRGAGL